MQSISYTYTSIHSTKNIIEFTQKLGSISETWFEVSKLPYGRPAMPAGCQVQRWQTQTKQDRTFMEHVHPLHIFYLNPKPTKKKHTILQKKTLKRTVCTWKDGILERESHLFQPFRKGWKTSFATPKCISQAWLRWLNLHVLRWSSCTHWRNQQIPT